MTEDHAMAKRRVLPTGAADTISSQLLPAFRERYDLVLLDREDGDGIREYLTAPGRTG